LIFRYQINGVKKIFDAILGVQPKQSGGSSGGESRETVVFNMAEDMLKKLPPAYISFEVADGFIRNLTALSILEF
jgi:dynein heavy chain